MCLFLSGEVVEGGKKVQIPCKRSKWWGSNVQLTALSCMFKVAKSKS